MAHFDKEKRLEQFDKLSPALVGSINSPESVDLVLAIANKNHLGEERSRNLVATVAYLILGLIHPEDLQSEIIENTQIDPRIAGEIAKEVKIKILLPIASELNRVHGFHMEVPSQLITPTQPQAPQPPQPKLAQPIQDQPALVPIPTPPPAPQREQEVVVIKPNVIKEGVAKPVSPFVIHEHEERESISEDVNYDSGLVRPSFYSPANTSSEESEPTSAPEARLEIGGTSGAQIEPQTTRVGREEASIVHYTAPETQIDPFNNNPPAPKLAPTPPQSKPKVDPKNIVDLKDIPK